MFLGLGIVVGGLVGLLTLTVGGLPLTLTTSGGALIMGLVFGWLRSVYPTFGRIPEPALWIFDTVGLAVFIGIVGLNAGPTFVAGLRETGPSLVFVALIVAILPHLVSLLFGYHVLKMNPVILLGACAGAGTITAALRAIQDESQSKLPVLGYTVPYAIGNILLTAWGPVIVVLTCSRATDCRLLAGLLTDDDLEAPDRLVSLGPDGDDSCRGAVGDVAAHGRRALPDTRFWPVTRLLVRWRGGWSSCISPRLRSGHCSTGGRSACRMRSHRSISPAVTYTTWVTAIWCCRRSGELLGSVEGLTGILMCGLSTGIFLRRRQQVLSLPDPQPRQTEP